MQNKRVLAFHYAWYGTPWGPTGAWRTWSHPMTLGGRYGGERVGQHDPDRILYPGTRDIGTMLYPMDGPYDSRDVTTIRRQLAEAREAAVDGFMLSWWGPGDQSDKALDVFMTECPEDFICANFETPYVGRDREASTAQRVERIAEGMRYLLDKHAANDRWIKMDGRPLLALWRVQDYAPADWARVKARLAAWGHNPFWLAQVYDMSYVPPMDALCIYTPFAYTLRGADLAQVYTAQKELLHARGALFAATANPGFDNRALHKPGMHIPRENGGYYRMTWEACLRSEPDFVVINSYNEWGESSVIESTRQYGKDYLEYTNEFVEIYKG